MRWPALMVLSALTVGLAGCDRIPFLGKKAAPPPDTSTQVAAAPAPVTAQAPPPAPTRAAAPAPRPTLQDEPWTPTGTGIVSPGMSRDQVVAIWGSPVAERANGDRTYLFFRNGCEVTCGTFDVVFLENGQVVDAIVRGQGHNYAGTSSSPPERAPQATPPQHGQPDVLTMPAEPAPAAPAAAAGDPRIADLEARHQASVATLEGKAYETEALRAFWGDAAFMQTCAPPGGPVAEPFTIYYEVLPTGELGTVVFSPETDVARCIRNQVSGRRFPPPQDVFVGRIDLKFTP